MPKEAKIVEPNSGKSQTEAAIEVIDSSIDSMSDIDETKGAYNTNM